MGSTQSHAQDSRNENISATPAAAENISATPAAAENISATPAAAENISATPAAAAVTPCRKNKRDDATFFEDLKDHIDELLNRSMEDHKNCFKSKMPKMFGMSKVVEERDSATEEALLTTTSN